MTETTTTRRAFLQTSSVAGAGLLLGFHLPQKGALAEALARLAPPLTPNAWVRIDTDGIVTVMVAKAEMGQGVSTSLPMLVAEELDADWSKVRYEFAPPDPVFVDPVYTIQITGGSTSVANFWKILRTTGAAGREMLVSAAAARWGADPSTCTTANSVVTHTQTGRKLSYGELVTAASSLPVPKEPKLKDPRSFKLIGKSIKRIDVPSKVNGSAVFGIDVKVPGVLLAVVKRPPVFGGTVGSFDATAARAVKGVRHIVQIDSGVAVVADGYWPAYKGREALSVSWNDGDNARRSSSAISKQLRDAAGQPGISVVNTGDASAAFAASAKKVNAEYEVPLLAHAAMEPMNCTARVTADKCEVWAPIQWQDKAKATAAAAAGLPPAAVTINTTLLGGGFGRKLDMDALSEAVQLSKRIGAPVKVIYSREDDMQHDFYRTAAFARMSAGVDAGGKLTSWNTTLACGSSMRRMLPFIIGPDNVDPDAVGGLRVMPYAIPAHRLNYVEVDYGVPLGAWRAVGDTWNAYFRECFIDEIAAAAGADPVAFRKSMMSDARSKAVLDLAAEKAGWGRAPAAGRFRGVAFNVFNGTMVAEVAEVSIERGAPKVHRIVAAVDCGTIISPDNALSQIEGGIVFGLTAALKGEITIEGGQVKQTNFDSYQMMDGAELPAIEVHFVASTEAPTGTGEPGVPPVAPAIANALRSATGVAVRSLPIRLSSAALAGRPG